MNFLKIQWSKHNFEREFLMIKEYRTIEQISDGSILVQKVCGVQCGEAAEIILPDGEVRCGRVISTDGNSARVQVFDGVSGMDISNTKVRFKGKKFAVSLSCDMLGRTFDGMGKAIDGGARILSKNKADIYGKLDGSASKVFPSKTFETEISVLGERLSFACGQKVAIISQPEGSYVELALRIAEKCSKECRSSEFAIVLAAMGITFDEADIYLSELKRMGLAYRTVAFINRSSDPTGERLLTPHIAMTAAEYLAFECGMKVLVIMTDISAYEAAYKSCCFAEKLISRTAEFEPKTLDQLCNDAVERELARIFERSGLRKGAEGSITLVPVLVSCDCNMPLNRSVKRLTDISLAP